MEEIKKTIVIDDDLSAEGIFKDSIFVVYPAKVDEVMLSLRNLLTATAVAKSRKGSFRLKVSEVVALSVNSQAPLVHCDPSRNAYGSALQFLRGSNAREYIERHWAA